MKRLVSLVTALAMILLLVSGALAQEDNVLQQVVEDCDRVLFRLNNVTLRGGVELSYEGQWFKTAEGIYQQEDFRSCWDLKVKSPRKDGSVSETGYTIYGDNDQVYVEEVMYPKYPKSGLIDPRDTVLRETLQTKLLTEVVRTLAAQVPSFLGEKGMTVAAAGNGGQEITLKLDESAPEFVNVALTMMMRFAGKRYFRLDEDDVDIELTSNIRDYLTVSRGVAYATLSMKVQSADVTLKVNEKGELESAAGRAALKLQTAKDGERLLEMTFHLEISDRGTTQAKKAGR